MTQAPASIGGAYQVHLKKDIINNILLLFIVVGIAFVKNIPIEIRRFLNTMIGSVIGLSFVAGGYYYFNWTTSLMLALFYILIINSSILTISENFEPGIDTRFVMNRKKWYIEQVLGENPLIIEESTVKTQAVQDDNSGMSKSIQSGSNL